MARSRTHWSLCRNPLPAGEDKLAGGVFTEGIGTPAYTPTPVIFYAPTSAPTPTPAPAPPKDTYTDVNLQQATKLALDSFV